MEGQTVSFTLDELNGLTEALYILERHERYVMDSKKAFQNGSAESLLAKVEQGQEDERVRHSLRFRNVANRYPRRVAEAYEGDLARAAADSDEQVAATVTAWEIAHGIEPRDWHAIGRSERDPWNEG